MKIKVPVKKEGIVSFYDSVASQLGYGENVRYDCTKIQVSNERAEAIEESFKDADDSGTDAWKFNFGASWVNFGPKVSESLHDDEVEVENEFIEEI